MGKMIGMLRNKLLCSALAILSGLPSYGQEVVSLDLEQTISIAADSSLSAFRAQNMYLSGFWEYKSYKSDRLPSLSLTLNPAEYYRSITKRYDSQSDLDVYRLQQTYSASGSAQITQNFDPLGGVFFIDSELDFMRNFGDIKSSQFSSIPIRIGYRQNLVGYNQFKWERKIEPLKFEKAKKQFVYDVESVSEEAVRYFFSLALAQAEYDLAVENLASCDTIYKIGLQRYDIAAISTADLLTLKLDKVNAENEKESATMALKRAMFSLASFLDMDNNTQIRLELPVRPKVVIVPTDLAITLVKDNNPNLIAHRQNVLESEMAVDKSRKEARFNANLNLSVGFNQISDKINTAYTRPSQQDLVSVGVTIPILDWGVRKGRYNMAKNDLKVTEITARQEEQKLVEDIVMTIDDFNSRQQMVQSSTEALELSQLAYEQTRQRFIIGQEDVSSLTLSVQRQQQAQRNYINALQEYWLNYYKIRRLTLFDFETGMPLAERFDFNKGCYR